MAKFESNTGKRHGNHHFEGLIIGAGFSGLYSLHSLRDRLGMSVKVLEAAPDIGGVWFWNRYPGARCDSESHVYGYTFSEELIREWEWTERFPGQAEILSYFDFIDRKLCLRRDIQFNTRVTSCVFDEAENIWRVYTAAGETFSAQFLISAAGCLSSVNVPSLPGLEDFKGRWYHTGNWPHEDVDFTGKRVGVVGTGSSGIQTAPIIAETASHLTVYQRTPSLSVPSGNVPLTAEERKWIKESAADIVAKVQTTSAGHDFEHSPRSAIETPADERREIYEKAWQKGGVRIRSTFADLLTSKPSNDTIVDFIKGKIKEVVKDPEVADSLTSVDHPYAAKRPTFDVGYYEIFNQPNVRLVDLRKDPILEVTPTGIRTSTTDIPLDIIVFATGYDAITGPLLRLDLHGADGHVLAKDWKGGPSSYLGLQIPGYPNLFTVTGPGSPSVLTNVPVAIQQHVEWITGCIEYMRAHGLTRIEPEPGVADWWGSQVEEAAAATLLPLAKSWYQGANVAGKPRIFMPYAGGLARYRGICREIAEKGYSGFAFR